MKNEEGEQKNQTVINAENKNLNFIQKNPQSMGAIFLGIITIVLILINASYVWVIPIIFGAKCLLKAKKIGENKKIIKIGYIFVYLPVLYWILASIFFAFNAINSVQ